MQRLKVAGEEDILILGGKEFQMAVVEGINEDWYKIVLH